MTDPQSIFAADLPATLPSPKPATAYAPSNIALSKYWGKRDKALNLPMNSSLSISLAEWGTKTTVSESEDSLDHVIFNGSELNATDAFSRKVLKFCDLFRRSQSFPLTIETHNSIPTAAGLASSASGFAALTRALCESFSLNLPQEAQSRFARFGSGSACRSLWHGFVRWDRGLQIDGRDSFAKPLTLDWPSFRIAIVPVDTGPKSFSSRDGMNHTVDTSPLFKDWPAQAERDCAAIEKAVAAQDIERLGRLAEANALAMHATMMAARPALTYLKPKSWQVLESLWAARSEGLLAFATMDAGANVKLVFESASESDVIALFPEAQIIKPFDMPTTGP